ncbi:hypothetical protein KIW84_010297 [Lathyrus oleraceus]|uniref:Filament-like plant protein n=1 Tax=Pisum sativum TaxID=3888 RepID=A0A9D5BDY1_PEA|nr:hypothetical protein KIW84_010297 [Pisum sativum]
MGLEDQVKTYEEKVETLEDEITELNDKLSAANTEINTKEGLVKQHAKVAEDAVSGWEKAEAKALALKNHLESVTLSKLTAEDQASQLDGALKECMRQIRNLKQEHEQSLVQSSNTVVTQSPQWKNSARQIQNRPHKCRRQAPPSLHLLQLWLAHQQIPQCPKTLAAQGQQFNLKTCK